MARAFFHDYTCRCIYHITMTKAPGVPSFGHLTGTLPDVHIELSPLGKIIAANINNIPSLNPSIRVLKYIVMPDHIHMLLFVTYSLERPLGRYMGMFKVKIGQQFRERYHLDKPVFKEDFYDCILHRKRSLDAIFKYISDNPRRLAVRRERPEYFRRINELKIGEKTYQAYGNFQLLDCPFKEQVVVHRVDSSEERERMLQEWLYTASNGGVLVSPFISKAEREVRNEAEKSGGRFILIVNEPFEKRYKPTGHDFELCESGRLLIISANLPGEISRQSCLTMNTLAETIAKG